MHSSEILIFSQGKAMLLEKGIIKETHSTLKGTNGKTKVLSQDIYALFRNSDFLSRQCFISETRGTTDPHLNVTNIIWTVPLP